MDQDILALAFIPLMLGLTCVILAGLVAGSVVLPQVLRKSFSMADSQERAEFAQKHARAIPARAVIVSAESRPVSSGSRSIAVDLTLDVERPAGAPYRANTIWHVDFINAHKIQPGQSVAAKIDSTDSSLIYPDEPWAEYYDNYVRVHRRRRSK